MNIIKQIIILFPHDLSKKKQGLVFFYYLQVVSIHHSNQKIHQERVVNQLPIPIKNIIIGGQQDEQF